jgi:hypothetical protein
MLYTFNTKDTFRNYPNLFRAPAHGNNLQAVMGIQMDMHGGNDLVVRVMLDVIKFVLQIIGVMVEDKGQGSYNLCIRVMPLFLDQGIANQIADDLRTIPGQSPTGYKSVKLREQIFGHGNTETDWISHLI